MKASEFLKSPFFQECHCDGRTLWTAKKMLLMKKQFN